MLLVNATILGQGMAWKSNDRRAGAHPASSGESGVSPPGTRGAPGMVSCSRRPPAAHGCWSSITRTAAVPHRASTARHARRRQLRRSNVCQTPCDADHRPRHAVADAHAIGSLRVTSLHPHAERMRDRPTREHAQRESLARPAPASRCLTGGTIGLPARHE